MGGCYGWLLIRACNPMPCPIHVFRPVAAPCEFNADRFRLSDAIGNGAFSNIYIGVDRRTRQRVAIKAIDRVQQLRPHFGTTSHAFLNPIPPTQRCVTCFTWCPC